MLATALAPVIGYDEAAKLAKEAFKSGRTIRELALERGMDAAEVDRLLDPGRDDRAGARRRPGRRLTRPIRALAGRFPATTMRAMTESPTLETLRTWRPEAYGRKGTKSVPNPIVEPLWVGLRVLAGLDRRGGDGTAGTIGIVDEDGDPILDRPAIEAALAVAARAESVIVDGYLTKQVASDGTGIYVGPEKVSFNLGARMTQFFVGGRIADTAEQAEARRQLDEASYFAPGDTVSLVIVDVIWLDGESLLDVPLLERKRQLESIIEASELVRLGAYVRPPIETWIGSWRAVGFRDLSFRGANSRYRPGAVGDDWATVAIPRR